MYQLPNLESNQYPTQYDVDNYCRQADHSDFKVRDTRPLMAFLNRILDLNPRIEGHVNTRRTAYSSFNYELRGEDNYVEGAKDRLRDVFDAILEGYIYSRAFGIFALKLRWEGEVPIVEEQYQPIQLDYDKNSLIIYDEESDERTTVTPGSQEYIWLINNPYGSRGGFLRKIVKPELLRNESIVDWADTNKRMQGVMMATIDTEKAALALDNPDLGGQKGLQENLDTVDRAARNVTKNPYVRAMDYVSLDAKSLANAQAGVSYAEFKKAMDADISIAILGTANLPELPQNGSYAAAKVQNLLRADILSDDMRRIKAFCDKFCLLDYRKNFNPNAMRAPFRFEWVFDENEDVEANARLIETVSRIDGLTFDKDEVYKKLGMTLPDGSRETITLKPANNGGVV